MAKQRRQMGLPVKWIQFRNDRFTIGQAREKFFQLTGVEATNEYNTGSRWCLWARGKWTIRKENKDGTLDKA